MELIKKLGTRIVNGRLESWGIYYCSFCLQEVEKRLDVGRVSKSCGCEKRRLISKAHKGMKPTEISRQKMSIAKIGTKRTEESKIKQSKATKGRRIPKEAKQNMSKVQKERFKNKENHPMFGKHQTEEARQKIVKAFKGRNVGKNNPNWKDGVSFEIYPQEFNKELKQFIKDRDNYACQYPGCTEIHDRLHVHHIDYNKKNNNSENLITLGTSCHIKTNYNREYWSEFYQTMMMNKLMECLL